MSSQQSISLWQFHGGLQLPDHKERASQVSIKRLGLPKVLYIPIKQHMGHDGELLVQPGEHVLRGQALTQPGPNQGLVVHAPTSGTVTDIMEHPSNHPAQLPELTIKLVPDEQHTEINFTPIENPFTLEPQELIQRIKEAGISGLGGAGFPTGLKLSVGNTIERLIINGVECEPYIVSDDKLMQEHAKEIIQGIEVLQYLLGNPSETIIAIEDNKPLAIQAMLLAAEAYDDIRVQAIPTVYPSGGERQLIEILTGQQVPSKGLPAHIGMLVQNVGTAYAIAQSVFQGVPLMERVVTVTGESLKQPGTYWTLLGTPVQHLLDTAYFEAEVDQRIIIGGPMMGYTISDTSIPVIKTTNCILAPSRKELPPAGEESPCIRCGMCEQVCPADLLPQQLQWYAKDQNYEALEQHNLVDCIECGACAYVCPSEIPLVHYYRKAKAEIRHNKQEESKSEIARQRYEARQERLEREKLERQERHKKAAEAREKMLAEREQQASLEEAKPNNQQKDRVAAALARAKARKQAQITEQETTSTEVDTAQEEVLAQPQLAQVQPTQAQPDKPQQTQRDRVAAAIARARAKRLEQSQEPSQPERAPKPADTQSTQSTSAQAIESDNIPDGPSPEEIHKARVAAALERARAKRAERQNQQSETTEDEK